MSADGHTATVPFDVVTGTQVIINAAAGNDSLTISGTDYRSATPAGSTQSLVLTIDSDFGAHPVGSYKAFNYNLDRNVAITIDTLFRPGTDPVEVVGPIVQREFADRGLETASPVGDAQAYENFAVTDDAVIFFFDQGQVAPQSAGPQAVAIPRAELTSLLA